MWSPPPAWGAWRAARPRYFRWGGGRPKAPLNTKFALRARRAEAAHLAMHGNAVVRQVGGRIGFIVAHDQTRFRAEQFEQDVRQPGVPVVQRADMPGAGDALVNRREAVHGDQNGRLAGAAVQLGG